MLARREQLLGEQTTETASGLDRPHPVAVERLCPSQPPIDLMSIRRERETCNLVLVAVNRDSCMGRLVRVDPDRARHECYSMFNGLGRRAGHS